MTSALQRIKSFKKPSLREQWLPCPVGTSVLKAWQHSAIDLPFGAGGLGAPKPTTVSTARARVEAQDPSNMQGQIGFDENYRPA